MLSRLIRTPRTLDHFPKLEYNMRLALRIEAWHFGMASTRSDVRDSKSSFQENSTMNRTIRILCVAVLSIVGLVGSSLPARADDKCDRDIHKAEDRLRDAVAKHGEHSRQADKRRAELDEVRRRCNWHDDHHDHDMEHH
jgi:hypothetical protein